MEVLNEFLGKIIVQIVNPVILLLIAAAFVVFLWGVFQFIRKAGDETERAKGKSAIFWGLIGFVIMFGVYGILNIATTTFGLNPVQQISK